MNAFLAKHKTTFAILSLLLGIALILSAGAVAVAAPPPEISAQDALAFELKDHIDKTTAALAKDFTAEAGGDLDWLTFVETRNGNFANVNHWYDTTKRYLEETLDADGHLDPVKVTEAQRPLLVANAARLDVADYMALPIPKLVNDGILNPVKGIDAQGENGRIFGVLTGSAIGDCEIRDTVDREAATLLTKQNDDGSFALKSGGSGEFDITAMALQALVEYTVSAPRTPDTAAAMAKAAEWLNGQQPQSSESISQRVIAFTALKNFYDHHNIKDTPDLPLWDTILADYEALQTYRDGLLFKHELTEDAAGNRTATLQGLMAETALLRYLYSATDLYDLSDVFDRTMSFHTEAAANRDRVAAKLQMLNDEAMRFLPWDKPTADKAEIKAWVDSVNRLPERLRDHVPAYAELDAYANGRSTALYIIIGLIALLILVNIVIFIFRANRVKRRRAEEAERMRRATMDEHHHLFVIGLVALALSFALTSCTVFQTKEDYYTEKGKDGKHSVMACIDARFAVESDELDPALKPGEDFPQNGIILAPTEFSFEDGDTALDLLEDIAREEKLIIDVQGALEGQYSSAYVKGISHLYEFSAGPLSGWMFHVNGELPQRGVSQYKLTNGDEVEFVYTLDAGNDVGSDSFESLMP